MPHKEVDYSKTHFYKIVCKDLSIKDCYVGHTTNFKNRKNAHKRKCYDENDQVHYNFYVFQFIRDNGGFDNFDMILINTECCENSLEARKREREYIEELNATLNKIKRPVRTREEERIYRKDFYENRKEEILEKNKLKIICDCGTTVRKVDFKRHQRCKKHQDYINSLQD